MTATRRVKTGGRKQGTKNKASASVRDRLHVLKCDPIEQLVIIARQAQKNDDLQLAGAMYKELAAYVAPKMKAIEVESGSSNQQVTEVIFTRAERPQNLYP